MFFEVNLTELKNLFKSGNFIVNVKTKEDVISYVKDGIGLIECTGNDNYHLYYQEDGNIYCIGDGTFFFESPMNDTNKEMEIFFDKLISIPKGTKEEVRENYRNLLDSFKDSNKIKSLSEFCSTDDIINDNEDFSEISFSNRFYFIYQVLYNTNFLD